MSRSDAAQQPEPGKLTPEKLIARFCGELAAGLRENPGTTEREDETKVSRGWCGYIGGRGDGLAVGFQDGYEFMEYRAREAGSSFTTRATGPMSCTAFGSRARSERSSSIAKVI
jgi:hypothetical protein